MMMDKNDTSTETLILIDWDWTQYGFRAFDLAYHMYYASFVRIFNFGSEDYDPEFFPDVELDDYFMPDKQIEKFLLNYLDYSGDTRTTIEEITTEFNIHTTYITFSKFSSSRKYKVTSISVTESSALSPTSRFQTYNKNVPTPRVWMLLN